MAITKMLQAGRDSLNGEVVNRRCSRRCEPDSRFANIRKEEETSHLVCAARRGDAAAYEKIYRKYRGMVTGLVNHFAPSGCDTDQLTQEVFVLGFRKLDDLRETTRLSSWLATIARNLALQARRSDRGYLACEFPETVKTTYPRQDDRLLQLERLRALNRAFRRLPEFKQRLMACVVLGLSDKEICSRLNRSLASVKLHKHRIRKLLAESILCDARSRVLQQGQSICE